jgi:4-diphosphocytidyl-2-C-methyl-D-erythritol kinase
LILKTPAKINFGLQILCKRPDGFHDLETVLQMVALFDEMEFFTNDGEIKLICNNPEIPEDESNLVFRAAKILRDEFPDRTRSGVKIRLKKIIPAGAGLGGGSGNAAFALMGLNKFWDLGLSCEQLIPFAASLGSDIPFFLVSPTALGTERGDKIRKIASPRKISVVIVFPGFSISTPWVYQNLKLELTKKQNNISILQKFLSQSDISQLGNSLQNHLEPVVFKKYPVVREIKDKLLEIGACGALMSGSGSAVFGVFEDSFKAKEAYEKLPKGEWSSFLTETVSSFAEFLPESLIEYSQNMNLG